MTTRSATAADAATSSEEGDGEVNHVELAGRLSAPAEKRALPSGDEIVTFRVVVRRGPGSAGTATVDTLECVIWSRGLGKRVLGWPAGSRVAVEGSLRRRFWRTGGSAGVVGSRTEVEVERARLVRRPSPPAAMPD